MHWSSSGNTAHEGNALQFLQTAKILGIAPRRVSVVGIAPKELHTEIGLSGPVSAALPEALALATTLVDEELRHPRAAC